MIHTKSHTISQRSKQEEWTPTGILLAKTLIRIIYVHILISVWYQMNDGVVVHATAPHWIRVHRHFVVSSKYSHRMRDNLPRNLLYIYLAWLKVCRAVVFGKFAPSGYVSAEHRPTYIESKCNVRIRHIHENVYFYIWLLSQSYSHTLHSPTPFYRPNTSTNNMCRTHVGRRDSTTVGAQSICWLMRLWMLLRQESS